MKQTRQEVEARLEELRQEFEDGLQDWVDELRERITADLPDPDHDIPPILDELLPDTGELVTWIRDNARELIGQIIADLSALIDRGNADVAVAFEDAFAGFLEDASVSDTVDDTEP